MPYIAVRLSSVHGAPDKQRMIYYDCTTDEGRNVEYGPIITNDPSFNPSAYCAVLLNKLNQEQPE
jgi:hypothetical protein